MTPQTIADAVAQIDELIAQLEKQRQLNVELIGAIDALRADRDTWRAAAQ